MKVGASINVGDWKWQAGVKVGKRDSWVTWGFGLVWCYLWLSRCDERTNWGFRVEYVNPRRATYECASDANQTVFGIQRDGHREHGEGDYNLSFDGERMHKPWHVHRHRRYGLFDVTVANETMRQAVGNIVIPEGNE